MPSFYHFKDSIAVGNIELIVRVNDILGNSHEYYPLIDIGEISFGNDKDSDIIYYPSNFDVEVAIPSDLYPQDNYWWSKAVNGLSLYDNEVQLLINGELRWCGYVYKKSVKANKISKSIRFNCIDQSQSFKEFVPSSNPLSYNLNNLYRVSDIIKDIFSSPVFNSTPYIEEIDYHGTIEARYNSSVYNFLNFFATGSYYYSSSNNYESMIDLAKNILLNYNLIGYFGMDRKFHLVPRVYEGQDVVTIYKSDLLKDPEFEMSYAIEGLQAKLWTGAGSQSDGSNFSTVHYGNLQNINDKEKVEKIQIDQPGGNFPTAPNNISAFSGVFVYHNNSYVNIATDGNFRKKLVNGSYSSWGALWVIPVVSTWDYIRFNRPKYRIEVDGVWDKWNFGNYYKFDGNETIYRLILAKYDLYKKRSSLTLKKAN